MKINNIPVLFLTSFILLAGCNKFKDPGNVITGDEIKTHIAVLANDSLQGRKPFTMGETKTTSLYCHHSLKKWGLSRETTAAIFRMCRWLKLPVRHLQQWI